ncbi:acyl-CoA thioesterase [Scatolibacter rhodanostii]|uniref:acyl-CoA thioesterase n=1 Tax=Scatolibacter rhodanostii TaxID=2014781 RepID=UPI000C0779E2|nr:thioesterase family protein [Scatolibacter rhodanostii]
MFCTFYERLIQYYETDKMGCVHHSNYIRWFEEARTKWLEETGFGYSRVEQMGFMIPVLEAEAKYIAMTHFAETVIIEVSLEKYTGSKASFCYQVTNKETGKLCCTGRTQHCFLNSEGKPVSLKRAIPQLHDFCTKALEKADLER